MVRRNVIWIIQKSLLHLVYILKIRSREISARKAQLKSINVIKASDELIGIDHYKILPGREYRKILEISHSILNPKTGVVRLKNNILKESSLWDHSDLVNWEPKPIFYKKVSGNYSFLPDNGYFHFLVEDLPRFIEVNKTIKNCHTIAGSNAGYLTQALDFLNPKNYSIYLSPVKVEKIFLSEKNAKSLFSINDLNLIKEAFLPNIEVGNRSIFISRKDSRGKKFNSRGINSKEIIEKVFLGNGFDVVYFEDLSLIEQVATSSSAKNIAGFHGAGLANIIWAAPNSNIIEVSNTRITRHFEHISEICSHKYSLFSTTQSIEILEKMIKNNY